jgi:DHA1 family multidrug resistance protein-like MFS transporter
VPHASSGTAAGAAGPGLSPAQSRRNQLAVTMAGFMGFAGFTLAMPFLPLYITQLGVTDVRQVALWTGLSLGATPAITMFSAPLWGRVGDRYGSKLLVMRSLAAFVLCKGGMAFVTAPWQLLALRALLGLFAGYGALTISMAAESAPRERMTEAIGQVQMGHRLGPALGPVLGGLLAPAVGLRAAFLVAAAFYLLALVQVAVAYVEPRRRAPHDAAARIPFATVLRMPHVAVCLAIILGFQLVDRSFGPVLPLFIGELGLPVSRIPLVSGLLFSLSAVCAAAGHKWAGPLGRRRSPRYLVVRSAVAGAAAMLGFVLAPNVWVVTVATVVFSVATGVAMTVAYATAGRALPLAAHATGFGLMTSASLAGLAISPIVAGLVAGASLRTVFAAGMLVLVAVGVLVAAGMRRDSGAG